MSRNGFTLVEVLIAITLLGLMMLGVYNVVDNSVTTKETTLGEDSEILQLETALSRFERDFECLYTPLFFSSLKVLNQDDPDKNPTWTFVPSEKFTLITERRIPVPLIENPDKKTLIFMTSTNRRKTQNSNQSNYAWVKYTLEDYGEHESFVRYFSANNPYSTEHDWDSIKPYVLIPKVKDLIFEFWDTKRERYVDSLELTADKNVPRIVKLKITWIDRYNIEQKIERVFRVIWPYFDTSLDQKESAKTTDENKDEE